MTVDGAIGQTTTLHFFVSFNQRQVPKNIHTGFLLFRFGLGCVVYQQGVEGQTVGQDEVPYVVPTDAQCVQLDRVFVFQGHFHGLQMCVHTHVDTLRNTRTMNLKFNSST